MARQKSSCKAYFFTDAQGDRLTLSETSSRLALLVTISDGPQQIGILLDAAQFTEMCALDGYDKLEVRTMPDPEPVKAPELASAEQVAEIKESLEVL